MNFKWKLLLLFTVLAFLPLSIFGLLSYKNAKSTIEQKNLESLESIVESRLFDISMLTELRLEQTRQIAGISLIRQLDPGGNNSPDLVEEVQELLETMYGTLQGSIGQSTELSAGWNNISVDVIGVWDPEGTIIANTNPELIGKRMPDRYLEKMQEKGGVFVGYGFDPLMERDYLMVLHEIRNLEENRFTGVVIFKINPVILNEISRNPAGLGETGEILISYLEEENSGRISFINDLKYADQLMGDADLRELPLPAKEAALGERGSGILLDYRGEEVLAVWRPVPGVSWGIVGKIDTAEIYTPIVEFRNQILVFALGLLVMTILIAFYASASISGPMNKLVDAFHSISRGELKGPVLVEREDELGMLANSANSSIDYLKKIIDQAITLASGNYDLKIEPVSAHDELGKALKRMTVNLRESSQKIRALLDETRNQNQALLNRHKELEQLNASLEEARARSQAILETSPDAIITIDEEGSILSFNKGACQIFGYEEEEVRGRNVKMLMPFPYNENHDEYMQRYLFTGEKRIIGSEREAQGLKKDGTVFPITLTISEVRWGDNRIFAGIIRDLSQRRELERRILEVGNEERRKIGRELHDGLGQALTGIRMMAESLARKLNANGVPGADEVKEIAEMLKETDEFARTLSRGMVQVDIEKKGLSVALKNLCGRTEKLTGIDCIYIENGNVEVKNHTMALHLYRIVQESVNNAVKHGSASAIQVRLSSNREHTSLVVNDDGFGFDPEITEERGMGIQIMKHRAASMGGVLEIARTEEQQTQIRCIVPNNFQQFTQ